ncbi:hypothetical protein FRACA_1520018 [Frankia canadensis]|uniref:Uncharacterized protein n=1 Tax=Frankia canadensis TaxID=1836972 RepID=A0A2I2KM46_9ACTN|nr:hypothetical protein FRACA_1520018 [Frankia canadensis]SOU54028.1 hypothetical protein FRACA_1520018 [Frankia canadensis]
MSRIDNPLADVRRQIRARLHHRLGDRDRQRRPRQPRQRRRHIPAVRRQLRPHNRDQQHHHRNNRTQPRTERVDVVQPRLVIVHLRDFRPRIHQIADEIHSRSSELRDDNPPHTIDRGPDPSLRRITDPAGDQPPDREGYIVQYAHWGRKVRQVGTPSIRWPGTRPCCYPTGGDEFSRRL